MRRIKICTTLLLLGMVPSLALAESFRPSPLAADAGIDALNRSVAQEVLERELFGNPYASVVIGNIDIYDQFPYLEARYFQVVSDPQWNRLLYGETDQGLFAFDGSSSSVGALANPRGLATDADGNLYVADADNDRIVVLGTSYEFDELRLTPRYEISGLARPYGLAVSDAGTPLDTSDDLLYVANTGKNEVVSYALAADGASLKARVGELGSGIGFFAGPMAIAVGRDNGVNTDRVFVADAHNSRLVELIDRGNQLEWANSARHEMGLVTSLDTDHWGSIYAAAPNAGLIQKMDTTMKPVAEMRSEVKRPRSFHVPFVNTHDHTTGRVTRAGHGGGLVVEEWSDNSGLRLVDLDVEVKDVAVVADETIDVSFQLTDRAHVRAEIVASDGKVVARRDAGMMNTGDQTVSMGADDFVANASPGEYSLRLRADSSYADRQGDESYTQFALAGAPFTVLPSRVEHMGAFPNPFNPQTRISFVVPSGADRAWSIKVFDLRGREVRDLGRGTAAAGEHGVIWDGRDTNGGSVSSGVYVYELRVDGDLFSGKLALVK